MKKTLIALASLVAASLASAQTPPPSSPNASVPEISQEENNRTFAGVTYLQQVDAEVREASAKVAAIHHEYQVKAGLAQAECDIITYTKLKAFDPKTAKVADVKIAEAQQRKEQLQKELKGQ